MKTYSVFVESMRRLYRDGKVLENKILELFESGKITEEEAKTHPDRNIITRAVGIMNFVDVDYEITDFTENDKILICTDGLNGSVDDEVIFEIAKSGKGEAADLLIKTAIDSGSRDNITVVLLDSAIQGE